MEYCYGKSVITVYISDYRNNSKTTDYVLDGQIIESLKIKDEKFEIEIRKVKDKQDKKENYVAYWKTDTSILSNQRKYGRKRIYKINRKYTFLRRAFYFNIV